MRFGTSNSLEGSSIEKAYENAGENSDTKEDPLQQTTNPILSATQGENQLIGILEEDSEDFDEDDEDDEDPDGDEEMLLDH